MAVLSTGPFCELPSRAHPLCGTTLTRNAIDPLVLFVMTGCRQYLQVLAERDGWTGTNSISALTVNGVTVPSSLFPCVPTAGTYCGQYYDCTNGGTYDIGSYITTSSVTIGLTVVGKPSGSCQYNDNLNGQVYLTQFCLATQTATQTVSRTLSSSPSVTPSYSPSTSATVSLTASASPNGVLTSFGITYCWCKDTGSSSCGCNVTYPSVTPGNFSTQHVFMVSLKRLWGTRWCPDPVQCRLCVHANFG